MINNSDALNFFRSRATGTPDPLSVKFGKNNDMTAIDAEFISKFSSPTDDLLDLGTGTGLIINRISDKFTNVTCVEPFHEFSAFIDRKEHVSIINSLVNTFVDSNVHKFSMITAFGLMQYFNAKEALAIYMKLPAMLTDNGLLIVKNQFGVNEAVTIDNFSEAIQSHYYSQYRLVEQEKALLKQAGFKFLMVYDIYPPEHNHWNNTHYLAIVASKELYCSL